jgi:hypothetical protein
LQKTQERRTHSVDDAGEVKSRATRPEQEEYLAGWNEGT